MAGMLPIRVTITTSTPTIGITIGLSVISEPNTVLPIICAKPIPQAKPTVPPIMAVMIISVNTSPVIAEL